MHKHTNCFTPRVLFALIFATLFFPAYTHAASLSVASGKTVTFNVTAAGTAPFNYQWRKDGVAISGATTASYIIAGVSTANTGIYTVLVSNAIGSTVSDNASLTVSSTLASTELTPSSYSARGENGASESVAMLFDGNLNTKWLDYSATSWVMVTFNSPTVLASYSLTSGNDVPYRDPSSWTLSGSNDGVTWTVIETRSGQAWASRLLARDFVLATPSASYTRFRFDLVPTVGCAIQLAEMKLFGPSSVTVTAPTITTQPASKTVTAGQSASFSVAATGSSLTYQWQKNGTAISGATSSTYTISSTSTSDAGTYAVVVSNSAGSATSTSATLSVNPLVVAPTISTQPVSLTVTQGNAATFSVVASGTSLSFQWMKNGAVILGATSASYTISSTALSDAGLYSVLVSNSAGSVTSTAVSLTVNALIVAPSITTQPLSQSVTEGSPATFSVVASGTSPNYQWMKSGAAIAGATSSSFTLATTALTDAATYSVVVSNSAGSVTSSGATLTVNSTLGFTELTPTSYCARGENNASEGVAMLFDGNVNTKWLDYSATTWVKVTFATPTVLDAYSLTSANDVPYRDPASWTLSGSNDGVTWTVIETRFGQSWASRYLTRDFVLSTRSAAYTQFRFDFVPSVGSALQLAELELYGASQTSVLITPSSYSARGQANRTYAISKLFDGQNSTKWVDNSGSTWVKVAMQSATTMQRYTITSAADYPQYDPVSWTLSGSNDGTNWIVIETRTAQSWSSRGLKREFTLASASSKYLWFRFDFKTATGYNKTQLAEMQFFGAQ
jgi:hypothetical protein